MAPNSSAVAQQYFDGWNRRDSTAVMATFADGGTYADPITQGPLSGAAIGNYVDGLVAAFPDLSFEIASVLEHSSGLVAAEWVMKGTNTGPFMNLPPTGRAISVVGADFVRVEEIGRAHV